MSKLSDLKDLAAEAGVEGYDDMTIAALEKALTPTPLVGVPTEPDKANLTENELESAVLAGEAVAPDTAAAVENLGVPTEPEKVGGATEVADPVPLVPPPPPAHSGADIEAGIGIPTEPDRGGLNPTEIELSGATANTVAFKKAQAAEKAAKKAAKKAAAKKPKGKAAGKK